MLVMTRKQGRGWAVACRLEPGVYWDGDGSWRARQVVMETLRAFGAGAGLGCALWDGRGVVIDGLSRQAARELQHNLNAALEAEEQHAKVGPGRPSMARPGPRPSKNQEAA